MLRKKQEKKLFRYLLREAKELKEGKKMRGYKEFFKGLTLEAYVNHFIEKILKIQSDWIVGSHASGADMLETSLKSCVLTRRSKLKTYELTFTGPRTQSKNTLPEKISFINNTNYKKILCVSIIRNRLFLFFFNAEIFYIKKQIHPDLKESTFVGFTDDVLIKINNGANNQVKFCIKDLRKFCQDIKEINHGGLFRYYQGDI